MHPDHMKEQFSHAYVKAVAAAAGVAWMKPSVDDDSIDVTLSRRGGRSPKLDLQLKCTAAPAPVGARFGHSIKLKNYDDLRAVDLLVPRVLVVVLVPDSAADWLTQTHTELVMRRCGYWVSLRGLPESSNSTGQTVDMMASQVFDVAALTAILDRIANGGLP